MNPTTTQATVPIVGTEQYNVPNTQTLGTINNSGNLNITPPPVIPNVAGTLTGLASNLQADAVASQNKADTATNDFSSLLKQYLEQSTEKAQLQQQYDTAGLGKKVRDLQSLQSSQTANYIQGLNNIELAKNTRQEANAQSVMLNRQYGIDALLTGAQLQSAQGNVEYANNLIKNALDLKYEPIKAQLDYQKEILSQLNTKAATDKVNSINAQLKVAEKQQKNDEDLQKIIVDASPFAPKSLLEQAKKAKTPIEAATILGQYSGDYLENQVKRATLTKTNAEIDKIRADIKASSVTINTSNLPNTATGFTTKLLATANSTKELAATERQSLAKGMTVISQLDSLASNIKKVNTGFTSGKVAALMSKVGANKDAGVVSAQLQAVIPNLARGVYGEVGVLTDNDIKNYRQTIPNLTSPEDQNDAVLALTLRTVKNSIENQLRSAANSQVNVSGWAGDYNKITKQIYDIEDRIGVSKQGVNNLVANDPKLAPVVKEMVSNRYTDGEILDALNAR